MSRDPIHVLLDLVDAQTWVATTSISHCRGAVKLRMLCQQRDFNYAIYNINVIHAWPLGTKRSPAIDKRSH